MSLGRNVNGKMCANDKTQEPAVNDFPCGLDVTV